MVQPNVVYEIVFLLSYYLISLKPISSMAIEKNLFSVL